MGRPHFVWCSLFCACSPPVAFVDAAAGGENFSVYATFDPGGGLETFGDTRAGPVSTPGREGSRLVVFELARADFAAAGGRPISGELWSGARLTRAGAAPLDAGSCARCLA